MKAMIVPVTPFQQNCTVMWCEETMQGAVSDPGG
ncbi:MAG: MBL fold metallo-hydrolase, partial [Alphaproteobacteria bacterium]|nr:MBL fold metallo-hydrolase [Alphaproteobacteria bacterium]